MVTAVSSVNNASPVTDSVEFSGGEKSKGVYTG